MRRADLADLLAFVVVADRLNFRAASARLEVTPSALSHAMRQLEQRLGVRLLHRTTRSVALTDAGLRLQEHLRPALCQISEALEGLNEERTRPVGRLRIHAAPVAAMAVIAPMWSDFLAAYPEIELEVSADDTRLDIVARGFDAGLGPRDRIPEDMIAVRATGPLKIAVVASPGYFVRHATPRLPDDLANHIGVRYRRVTNQELMTWQFERDGDSRPIAVAGPLTVNSSDLVLRAALDGLGLVYTLEAIAEPFIRSGQLVRVLEDWSPHFEGMFLYYPGHRHVPAALRALIDMIRARQGDEETKRALANLFPVDNGALELRRA